MIGHMHYLSIKGRIPAPTITSDDDNNNNNDDRLVAISSQVHSSRVGGVQKGDSSTFLIFLRTGSSFHNFSVTMTLNSSTECLEMLKCAATSFSLVLLCLMSAQWLVILQWGACHVVPAYYHHWIN